MVLLSVLPSPRQRVCTVSTRMVCSLIQVMAPHLFIFLGLVLSIHELVIRCPVFILAALSIPVLIHSLSLLYLALDSLLVHALSIGAWLFRYPFFMFFALSVPVIKAGAGCLLQGGGGCELSSGGFESTECVRWSVALALG
eukprot:TRINITY_DN1288_c0_g1_i2.p1 TRINITY_DN1288_c0_g1~~TRINITY_DN1288_c0_g1_i2.p1  ORF type:complete len:141 (+),score=1.83 TRINITY_DN1288_c0_g1_i2:658-1080(+)